MKSTTTAGAIHAALTRNLRREHGFEPMEVEGTLPPDLEGTLYRVGPGLFERFGRRVNHPFEADGAMSAVRIADGQAKGAVRVVRGRGFQEEERAGRHLYSSRARLVDRLPRSLRGLTKNVANTSPVLFQDRLFAQVELSLPTELSADLHTLGEQNFGGVLTQGMSAHPHRVASLRTTFNFHVQYGREPRFELIALPDSGPVRQLGGFTLPWAGLIHDFAVTDKHVCVLLCPAKLVTHRAVLRLGSFDTWFRFHPELGARLLIAPLSAPSEFRTVPLEPFWTWHIANAFEDGEGLVDRPVEVPRPGQPRGDRLGQEVGPAHDGAALGERLRRGPLRALLGPARGVPGGARRAGGPPPPVHLVPGRGARHAERHPAHRHGDGRPRRAHRTRRRVAGRARAGPRGRAPKPTPTCSRTASTARATAPA
jgi:carotenoid cleavage dioxygenase-like enzyme